jgi:hypothetical protein
MLKLRIPGAANRIEDGETLRPVGTTTVTLTVWLKPFRLITERLTLALDPTTKAKLAELTETAKSCTEKEIERTCKTDPLLAVTITV